MNRTSTASLFALLALAVSLGEAAPAGAADRRDGPAASADPAADISDLYAWTGGDKVYLALTVSPAATESSKFSTKVYYVFHTSSRQTVAAVTSTPSTSSAASTPRSASAAGPAPTPPTT